MKLRFSLLLATLTFFCFSYSANAAFIVKKTYTAETTKAAAVNPANERVSNRRELVNNLTALKRIALHEGDNEKNGQKHRDTSGWEGIVALCCGICSANPLFAVGAIVFGALGMAHGKRHRGLAIAGLVLGIVAATIWLAILLFSGSMGMWWA